MKKLYLLAITFVVAGLMITSATTMATTTASSNDITAQNLAAQSQTATFIKIANHQGTSTLSAGTLIPTGDYAAYHPSMAVDTAGTYFVGIEASTDGTTYYPNYIASPDQGTTWPDGGYFPDSAGATYPMVDFKTGGFYGTLTPNPDSSTNGQAWIIDATDVTTPTGALWDFGSYGINEFKDVHIATYTHAGPAGDPGVWNWGGIALTGYNGYNGANVIGCPYVLYQYSEAGGAMIGWLNNVNGCEHASIDIDQVTNMSYSVYDRVVTGKYQLLVRKDNYGSWTPSGDGYSHPMVTTKTIINATGNLSYPAVVAGSNNVIIVAQNDAAGNKDIVCFYSINGMSAYSSSIVANSGADELYPQISLLKPGVAVCTYIRGTEAYFRQTNDGGVTWSAEARVSDEQIAPVENHALGTCGMSGKGYAIWQDGRGTKTDIYFNQFAQVEAPNVEIGTVTGSIGKVSMEVKNTGTGAAANVAWSISVKGGMLGRINVTTTGVIATLAAGASETVQTDKFIFGLGSINIQLAAGPATLTKTGKVLIVIVKIA
jgi:hypothetical protein